MSSPPPNPSLFAELRRLTALSHAASNTYSPLPPSTASSTYDVELNTVNTQLRRLIIDDEMAIASLQSQLPQPNNSNSTRHLRASILANQQSFKDAGYIPPASSPLNLLLAYRSVLHTITSNTASLPIVQQQLEDAARSLSAAKTLLAEQQTLHASLEVRLQELEDPPLTSRAKNATSELKARNEELLELTRNTMRSLHKFIGAHLVALLEIEELGGPVVGLGNEEVDAKKVLARRGRGQMTLEEAFRATRRKGRERGGGDEDGDEEDEEDNGGMKDEITGLLEDLMHMSLEPEPYVTLDRESAVARFLVRAKVAEFHHRDARKIKLVDFGGGFDE
ncbi:hypothetical protein K440DRAFT_297018 [Wilcoxina mikolae CBS 423.85]|nr:hypothetical protein K440DRAFT_297018 [Wilcoxina mikolae CBS 423.85]